VHEDYEVCYWTKELGVSEQVLKQLVDKHGISAKAICETLGSRNSSARRAFALQPDISKHTLAPPSVGPF
jgi:hypothetical protein